MANAPLTGNAESAPAVHSKPTTASVMGASVPLAEDAPPNENPLSAASGRGSGPPVAATVAGGSPEAGSPATTSDEFVVDWGFDLNELYRMARTFFCQNEGKAFHITYEDKLKLIAYTQQERHGPYDAARCEPVGYLDLIGQDRREAWVELGPMDALTAKQEFVALLHDRCPLFRPFVCAHKASKQLQNNKRVPHVPGASGDTASIGSNPSSPSHGSLGAADGFGPNETMIKSALNQQTLDQFSAYAAQQAPNDKRHQQAIIAQLQEEHFKQYMKQLAEQTASLSLNNGHSLPATSSTPRPDSSSVPQTPPERTPGDSSMPSTPSPNQLHSVVTKSNDSPPLAANTAITQSSALAPGDDSRQDQWLKDAPQHVKEQVHGGMTRSLQSTQRHRILMPAPPDRVNPDQANHGFTPDQGTPLLHLHHAQQHQQELNENLHRHQHHAGAGDHDGGQAGRGEADESDEDESSLISVNDPVMWTRADIVEFKEGIRQEGGDSIIKVGHGETVTVRVPTHDDGQQIFWEFATDHYDIGFGVFFEWTKTPGSAVSVHISDSEDESCEEEEDQPGNEDVEAVKQAKEPDGPPMSIIVPVYRRDSHLEVYVGKHPYPGQGVYLLKFDNSYSLWRGKTLYYRVYYIR